MLKPVRLRAPIAAAALFSCCVLSAGARAQSAADPGLPDTKEAGRVVLVLPFDNRSGNPSLNWIGDSFPDTLDARLSSAGFVTITRDDRLFALDHLGLPADFRPSRATTIRIAQTLDADYVIVGSYHLETNSRIAVQAQVLETNKLRLSTPLADSSELPRLFDVENAIAWKIARQIDPRYGVSEQTFLAASGGVELSAFENYVRGTDAPTAAERVKRLELAVATQPDYAAAQLALGKELYATRDYDQAAAVLAKVPANGRLALEANFYLGLARFNNGKYAEAQQAFQFVAAKLPLSEVVNDAGVALARQGKDGSAEFQRATTADPNDPDYHYNYAVTLLRKGDFAGANREVDASLKLRPNDGEAAQLKQIIAAGRTAAKPANGFEPTERLKRTFSEAAFRQATAQLDQIRALRLSTLAPAQQAAEDTQQGRDYQAQGLLPEAEREFAAAVAIDPGNAQAHLALAQIRLQTGALDDARTEALAALKATPGFDEYLVLAQIDVKKQNWPAAAPEIQKALALQPNNVAALAVRTEIQKHGQNFQ